MKIKRIGSQPSTTCPLLALSRHQAMGRPRAAASSYDRPVSPQGERDVGSNAIAALPSGEASHSFSS